jgi:hypothetical protein
MFAAMLYESRWFAAVAVYYLLLVCTRYILYLTGKRHAFGERESASLYKSLRSVGIVMLMLNLAMASIIIYTIATERAKVYSPVVIYLFVVYTVSIFVFNAASLYINRKKRLPYSYLITRIISFCASLMSLFNLVNSLVFTLGIEKRLARVINAFVGCGVIFFVLFLCIAIIVKCNKRLRCCTPYEGDGKVAKS